MDAWAFVVITLLIGTVLLVTAFSTAGAFLMVITMINMIGLIITILSGVQIYNKYSTIETDVNNLKSYRVTNERQITNLVEAVNYNDTQLKAYMDNLVATVF